MNKNIILIIAGLAVAFIIFKLMKTMKDQSEIMKSQTDILMAVAIKTGALQPAEKQKQIDTKKDKTSVSSKAQSSPVADPNLNGGNKKPSVLTTAHKKLVKLFDDEIPKTAGQLRLAYNKVSTAPMETKKFNSMLWNLKNNKSVVNFEKFEDSDSVWGLTEWFEVEDDGNCKLTDEYFNRILSNKKV